MSLPENQALHFLHVFGALLLVGYNFYAFAGPAAETRKKVMMVTGIASLLILLTGLRMWQALYGFGPFLWVIVKAVCWLALSGFAGVAYRRREKAGVFTGLTILFAALAVAMVYFQPGGR